MQRKIPAGAAVVDSILVMVVVRRIVEVMVVAEMVTTTKALCDLCRDPVESNQHVIGAHDRSSDRPVALRENCKLR